MRLVTPAASRRVPRKNGLGSTLELPSRGRALALEAPLVIVHAPEGSPALRVTTPEGAVELSAGHTVVAGGRIAVAQAPGGVAAACELTPVSEISGRN